MIGLSLAGGASKAKLRLDIRNSYSIRYNFIKTSEQPPKYLRINPTGAIR